MGAAVASSRAVHAAPWLRAHTVGLLNGLVMFWIFCGGMVITAVAALALMPSGQVGFASDASWWPYALGLALCLLFSNLSLQYGAARLAANTTALVMLSEIVFATASSVALGASELSARKLLGGLLIVFAAVLATMPTSPKEPP